MTSASFLRPHFLPPCAGGLSFGGRTDRRPTMKIKTPIGWAVAVIIAGMVALAIYCAVQVAEVMRRVG